MNRAEMVAAMQAAAAAVAKPKAIDIPEWGGTVYIRQLTVAEVEDQQELTADRTDKRRLARAAARLICDENGDRLFDSESDDDVALIAQQGYTTLLKLSRAAELAGDAVEGAGGNASAPSGNS